MRPRKNRRVEAWRGTDDDTHGKQAKETTKEQNVISSASITTRLNGSPVDVAAAEPVSKRLVALADFEVAEAEREAQEAAEDFADDPSGQGFVRKLRARASRVATRAAKVKDALSDVRDAGWFARLGDARDVRGVALELFVSGYVDAGLNRLRPITDPSYDAAVVARGLLAAADCMAAYVSGDPIARARGAATVYDYFRCGCRRGGSVEDLYEDVWECHCLVDDVLFGDKDGKPKPHALYEELGLMIAWSDVIDCARENGLDVSDSETVCRLISQHDREALG